MSNIELLHASQPDIIFDNHNKNYGAYPLRKDYNHRLAITLSAGLSLVILIVLVSSMNNNENILRNEYPENKGIFLTVIDLPKEKIKKPEPVTKQAIPESLNSKTSKLLAAVAFLPIEIVPDNIADTNPVAILADLVNRQISAADTAVKYHTHVVNTDKHFIATSKYVNDIPEANQTIFLSGSSTEFPGGGEALMKFHTRNLRSTDELGNDEKKIVKARFKVNPGISVSFVGMVQSAGESFLQESNKGV